MNKMNRRNKCNVRSWLGLHRYFTASRNKFPTKATGGDGFIIPSSNLIKEILFTPSFVVQPILVSPSICPETIIDIFNWNQFRIILLDLERLNYYTGSYFMIFHKFKGEFLDQSQVKKFIETFVIKLLVFKYNKSIF